MAKMGFGGYVLLAGGGAVALMLAVAFFAYGSGWISSITGPIYNSSIPSSCPYGYVCGIKADGCALPGAIYNCPEEPANPQSNTIAVNLTQELKNSAKAGFILNESMFYANSGSECSRQLISQCDNNEPDQFICVNQQYSGAVSSQYGSAYPAPVACPMFLMAGNVSCGLAGNHCVVVHQGFG